MDCNGKCIDSIRLSEQKLFGIYAYTKEIEKITAFVRMETAPCAGNEKKGLFQATREGKKSDTERRIRTKEQSDSG